MTNLGAGMSVGSSEASGPQSAASSGPVRERDRLDTHTHTSESDHHTHTHIRV